MASRPKYKTKQLETLIAYMEGMSGQHVTAGDVCTHFKSQGLNIGQSTVYRQLERLVDDGIVGKYIIDANSPACFEYIAEGAHHASEICFHCKCEECGKLIHLHCEDFKVIQSHLQDIHGFTLNPMRTVFYGMCEDCKKKIYEESDR